MFAIEYFLLIVSALILLSIVISRFSDNFGVPTLIMFLGIGMLAGSEGPGGIFFDDAGLAQAIGIVALIFILFNGGLDTNILSVRPVIRQALSLATLGVFITAISVGIVASYILNISFLNGLLLGSVISSTDAAAVFSVLRSRNVHLKGTLKPLLELESGSNDPMSVFLTVAVVQALQTGNPLSYSVVFFFILQMGVGAGVGLGLGKLMVVFLNRLKSSYEGMYPVFSLAYACFVYGITASLGGSGFLAVYIAGITVGNAYFIQKKSLLRFFDGLAWLSQIGMFLALGLLVYPSRLMPIIGTGLLISLSLIFIARPLSVFIALSFSNLHWKEKSFVSWVGLRGAVPIILATFPLLAKLPHAEIIFNIVFFIVLTSALLQGWSMPMIARLLGVEAPPPEKKRSYPLEFAPTEGVDTELIDFVVPYGSGIIGMPIVELELPDDSLVVLISRGDSYIVPSGGTLLEEGDALLILVNKKNLPQIKAIISRLKESEDDFS